MKYKFIKDSVRKLNNSKSRYISIILIVILGVAFFTGMNSISYDMELTADKYLKESNVYDFQFVYNLGITLEDIEEIRRHREITSVEAGYVFDVIIEQNSKRYPIRVNSINLENTINKNYIVDGRNIKEKNECLIDTRLNNMNGYEIGDTIKIESGTSDDISENFEITDFKIVGIVKNPAYLSMYYGATELESGELTGLIMIDKENFKLEEFNIVYAKTNIDKNLNKFDEKYDEKLSDIEKRIENTIEERAILRYKKIYDEIEQEILDAKRRIILAKKEISDAKKELIDAKNKIDKNFWKLGDSYYEYKNQTNILSQDLKDAKKILSNAKTELDDNDKTLKESEIKLNEAKQDLNISKQEMSQSELSLQMLDTQIKGLIIQQSNLSQTSGEYNILKREIEKLDNYYNQGIEQLNNAKEKITSAEKEIVKNEEKLKSSKNLLQTGFDEYNFNLAEYNSSENIYNSTISTTEKTINYSKNQIYNVNKDYYKAREEFLEESAKAEKEILDGENDVKEAEFEVEALSKKWIITRLTKSGSFISLKNDLEKMGIMGKVFPVIFFIVATLVTITTITRTIEEDRSTIGTFKGLGYSKKTILLRYLTYAVLIIIIGTILGTIIGSYFIVQILYAAYSSLYVLPELIVEINPLYTGISCAITGISIMTIVLIISLNVLKQRPSELLRIKAAKPGKQIFLEKSSFIWSKLSFWFKVSFRNIFRYKRRLLMTIIGIAGCTALIYTGIALKSSIDNIARLQFSEIKFYDMEVNLKTEMNENGIEEILEYLGEKEEIRNSTPIRQKSIKMEKDGLSKDILYTVIKSNSVEDYIKLENLRTGEKIEMSDNGAVLTEKLAKMYNLKIGDKINIIDEVDNIKKEIEVTGITENYLYNYIYMTPNMYEKIYEKEIKYSQILVNIEELSDEKELELISNLKENEGISSVIMMKSIDSEYQKSLKSLLSVVFMCIGCAIILAFVVLFNLNTINIEERKRELATIKVLGFFDNETASYVFRENVVLTIMGIILGLFLGIFVLELIMQSAEVETILLSRKISIPSFIYSGLITFLCTLITNTIMKRKINKINMIDSLKSVE